MKNKLLCPLFCNLIPSIPAVDVFHAFFVQRLLVHLSPSSSYTPRSVHDASDSSQSLLTPPQSLLSAQVSRYGGADHVTRTADEEASDSQQHCVYHLVVR